MASFYNLRLRQLTTAEKFTYLKSKLKLTKCNYFHYTFNSVFILSPDI